MRLSEVWPKTEAPVSASSGKAVPDEAETEKIRGME